MLALLAAGAIAAQPPRTERTPNLFVEPTYCPSVLEQEARRQETALRGRPAGLQYAVYRRLNGCSVPTPVGYHPDYLLPGAADPAARREDAPSNRR